MDRRDFTRTVGSGLSVLAASSRAPQAGAAGTQPPNVLLVIGDDMTWTDCEPYGNTEVHAPNMARLAREGMCFDAMFTSTAMCAPTRQQLYSGMYPVRNGAYPNHSRVYDGTRSMVHHLKDLGYRVGLIGKKHFGPPESCAVEHHGALKGKGEAPAVVGAGGAEEREAEAHRKTNRSNASCRLALSPSRFRF